MNLLDDLSLDTFKLTQHVAVLRLMEAPPLQVVEKFLNAHSYRSQHLIKSFNTSSTSPLPSTTINSLSSQDIILGTIDTNDGGSDDMKTHTTSSFNTFRNDSNGLENVSLARTFHQSFLAGLVEACKGISGLFAIQSTDSLASPKNKAISPGSKSSKELEDENMKRIENGIIANKKLLLTLEGNFNYYYYYYLLN
jgi:hypothetical protein